MTNRNKYLEQISKFKNIIIYGSGAYGKRTYEVLEKAGLKNQVVCFANSDKKIGTYYCKNKEVKSIYALADYYRDTLFLLATSDQYFSEIKCIIKELKIKHYFDSRKLYLDSYQHTDFVLKCRNIRNIIYRNKERLIISSRNGKTAAHITYCITNNAGDTVLSQCVRKFLAFRKWKMISVTEKVDTELIKEINQTDLAVIGGGGLFLPDTNANSISGWQWAISNEQIDEIKVPIVIFSVGYNYFKNQEITELFIKSLNKIVSAAVFIGLRNRGSVEAVRQILPDDLKGKVTYQPCTTTLIRKIYNVQVKKNTKIVAFNVAFDREERRFGEDKDAILQQIAKAAYEIEKKGYKILYIAHCDDDLKFLPYLEQYNVNYKVKNLTQSLPMNVIRLYRNVEVTIGMRGHAQMIPFGIGGKIISLGTHKKMRWFLEDIGLEECYVDLNKEVDRITERVVTIFETIHIKNPIEMDRKIWEKQEKLWEISCQNREKIYQIMKDGNGK